MTIAYVILAAGRGSRMGRVGESLHKALLPLQQRAILTHLIELGPPGAELIICTGYRADQLRDYMALAHPGQQVTWVPVPGWDQPGGGPGASLLAARSAIGARSAVITSCDTLWTPDHTLWSTPLQSWAAHAPIPAGTSLERWCRLAVVSDRVIAVVDKQPGRFGATRAYPGLMHIAAADLPTFWRGIETSQLLAGELRDPAGLAALADAARLGARRVGWTDTGDALAYRRAVMLRDGYDWSKEREATWVLPEEGRVIKWWADDQHVTRAVRRQRWLESESGKSVPSIEAATATMLALRYIPGQIGYDAVKTPGDLTSLVKSRAWSHVTQPLAVDECAAHDACWEFYHNKTTQRVAALREPLRELAEGVLRQVPWATVMRHCRPAYWHGDFNLGNMIFDGIDWHLIDWRDAFGGNNHTDNQLWGDYRHDVAKFMAGLRIQWDWARHGDFTPWPVGQKLAAALRSLIDVPPGTEEIGVLSLLSSAPLHEHPLDEVIVTRAAEWLSELKR